MPVDERPEGEDAAELGVRAARLRAADEARHSFDKLWCHSSLSLKQAFQFVIKSAPELGVCARPTSWPTASCCDSYSAMAV